MQHEGPMRVLSPESTTAPAGLDLLALPLPPEGGGEQLSDHKGCFASLYKAIGMHGLLVGEKDLES